MNTDYQPTTDYQLQGQFTHFAKISNGHNSATHQPIPFMFGSRVGFSGTADQTAHFRLDQIQDGDGRHLEKLQMVKSLKRIIRFTVCMYADHTLLSDSNL